MKTIARSILLAAMMAASLPVGATVAGIEGPWSVLVAGVVPSNRHAVFLIVSSIDGETPVTGTVAVKPGKKQVLVDTPATAKSRASSHKRIEIDMAPCMRYYVAGMKESPLSLRWTPEVFRIEPIGECVAEFRPDKGVFSPQSAEKPAAN